MNHKRMIGDKLTPLNAILRRAGNPIDLVGLTAKFQIEKDDGTVMLAETATGVTAHPTQTFTVDTTNNWLINNSHGLQEHDQVVVSTTTTLPAGLLASTRYFVKDATPNNFKLALKPGGEEIDITSGGTGTHSYYAVGSVQYAFATAAVASAYIGRGWFTLFSGADRDTLPTDSAGIRIEVLAYGN